MEAGWKETADYYYNSFAKTIFTDATNYLYANPGKTFTQAEIWFFQKWWAEQDVST